MRATGFALVLIGAGWLASGYASWSAGQPQVDPPHIQAERARCDLERITGRREAGRPCPPPAVGANQAMIDRGAILGGIGLSLAVLGLGLMRDGRRG